MDREGGVDVAQQSAVVTVLPAVRRPPSRARSPGLTIALAALGSLLLLLLLALLALLCRPGPAKDRDCREQRMPINTAVDTETKTANM